MGRSISLPFLQLPEIKISAEEAYKILINGGIVTTEVLYVDFKGSKTTMYIKQHPRRRGKFISSFSSSFKSFETFCIARTKQAFLDRYQGADIFYLFT